MVMYILSNLEQAETVQELGNYDSGVLTEMHQTGYLRGGSEVKRILPFYKNLSCRSESVYVISQCE